MTKQEFAQLFQRALEQAALNAEQQLGRKVSRHYRILLHGAGHPGDLLSPEAAVDALYLNPDKFFRFIDVAVVEVSRTSVTIFARASDHTPVPFDQTGNTPPGSGPFKQLISKQIQVVDG